MLPGTLAVSFRLCQLVEEECALMEPEEVLWKAGMFCGALVDGVWERGRVCSDAASANFIQVPEEQQTDIWAPSRFCVSSSSDGYALKYVIRS